MQKDYLQGVHGLRAIAAIAVVIYHAGGVVALEKYQGSTWTSEFFRSLDTGVDIFFVISGFVISLPFFLGKTPTIYKFFAGRVLRIYPMSIVTAAIFIVSGAIFFGRVPNVDVLLSSFLLIPSATDPVPLVLWTLKQELLFYAIFGLVFFRSKLGLAIVCSWSIASPFIDAGNSYILSWLFHPKNIEFCFGIAAAYLFVSHKMNASKSLFVACFGFVAFAVCGVLAKAGYLQSTSEVILLGSFGFMTLYGLACSGLRLPRIVLFLGSASYSIYLIHFFALSAANKVLFRLTPGLPDVLALVVITVAGVLVGCVYYATFERPIEAWRSGLKLFRK